MKTGVWVDGRRWRQVASFAEARPDDEVFVLDAENGSLLAVAQFLAEQTVRDL